MARCARRSLRMAQCCRLGAAKRRASAGAGAKVLARSMAIANRAAWQIGGRRGTAETAAQYAAKYDAYITTVRAVAPTKPILCITPIPNRADLKTGGNQRERPAFSAGHRQCPSERCRNAPDCPRRR